MRSNKDEADEVVGEIEAAGGKALAVLADVADPKVAQALADAAVKRFGRIDILVNNAALRRENSIVDMSTRNGAKSWASSSMAHFTA